MYERPFELFFPLLSRRALLRHGDRLPVNHAA